uniref:HNH endonuclease signature motif containing protein n=1 Tax=Miniimonas arenae TaxID=676201 RepID=UPI0028A8ED04
QASVEPDAGVRVATRAQAQGEAERLAASRLDALVLLCAEATLPGEEPGTWKQALGSRRSETILHVTLDDLAAAQPRTLTPNAQARDTPQSVPAGTPTTPAAPGRHCADTADETRSAQRDTPRSVPAGTSASPAALCGDSTDTASETPSAHRVPAGTSSASRAGGASRLIGPRLELGPSLHPETARRLTCGTGITLMLHHPEPDTSPGVGSAAAAAGTAGSAAFTVVPSARPGATIDVGRRRRLATPAQLKALWERDHGCRVPGCERRRYLHAHHLIHWADGGPTTLNNLVLVCSQHHRLLHEDTYALHLHHQGRGVTLTDPNGRVVASSGPTTATATGWASAMTAAATRAEQNQDGEQGNLTAALPPVPLPTRPGDLPLDPVNGGPLNLPWATTITATNRQHTRPTPDAA